MRSVSNWTLNSAADWHQNYWRLHMAMTRYHCTQYRSDTLGIMAGLDGSPGEVFIKVENFDPNRSAAMRLSRDDTIKLIAQLQEIAGVASEVLL